jgi:hypothetical protein
MASPSNVTGLFRYLVPLRVKRAYSCYRFVSVPGTVASKASLLSVKINGGAAGHPEEPGWPEPT